VTRLRSLKSRQTKPLALMARDIETVDRIAHVSPREREYLRSARRPIVLLQQKFELPGIAPGLRELGIMLPYTPLHFLLLKDLELIVATSSNRKDSPIMKEEEEGLYDLCDAILTHDRPIAMRADDSVMKISRGTPLFVRRARGYVPYPQPVPLELQISGHVLALGAELKDTVSVYKNGYVVTSQFLGDLDEYQNFAYFEETIAHLSRLFEIRPQAVVSDLHPDFHTTRYAQRLGLPHFQVQHHFAHVLATLLEHRIPPGTQVFGVSWDGFGYGSDTKPWGAEFMKADYAGFERLGSFRPVPLPGGDLASKQPWRMALSYLADAYGEDLPPVPALEKVELRKIKGVLEMIRQKLNTPEVSSCGRLFDAVSFLTGLAPLQAEYEAEAPMRLEAVADCAIQESYPMEFSEGQARAPYQVCFHTTIRAIVQDINQGVPPSVVSSRFHNTLAEVISRAASQAQTEYGLDTVVLTGGVFLNRTLLEKTLDLLEAKKFRVLRPEIYSPNDESISVGQIAYALNLLRAKS
jgi:hydrogenase maturation protein HypF